VCIVPFFWLIVALAGGTSFGSLGDVLGGVFFRGAKPDAADTGPRLTDPPPPPPNGGKLPKGDVDDGPSGGKSASLVDGEDALDKGDKLIRGKNQSIAIAKCSYPLACADAYGALARLADSLALSDPAGAVDRSDEDEDGREAGMACFAFCALLETSRALAAALAPTAPTYSRLLGMDESPSVLV